MEVAEGSHGDPRVVDAAFDGADAVFWLAPPDPQKTPEEVYLDFTRPAVEADDTWTGQEEMPVLGPEDLSPTDMAAIMSQVLGREIRYQQIPFDAMKARLLGQGASESFAQGFIDMMRAKNEGMDSVAARDARSRTPTTFRQWCEMELARAD